MKPRFDTLAESLCESPHDDPPGIACMLTVYFDESFEDGDGWAVMAAFVGTKEQWLECAEKWRKTLHPKTHLHMRNLRWRGNRHQKLLADLAEIPHQAGLQPVYAAVRLGDFRNEIEDYLSKQLTHGYFVSLMGALIALMEFLDGKQRVELIFEQQSCFAAVRELALETISDRAFTSKKKKRVIAKWSTVSKSTLTEPSDYLAYAILQTLLDPKSLRSRLCAPILNRGKKRIGGKMSKVHAKKLLTFKKTPPL